MENKPNTEMARILEEDDEQSLNVEEEDGHEELKDIQQHDEVEQLDEE